MGQPLIKQYFATDKDPFDCVNWGARDAVIKDATGEVIFEQKDVEFPAFWSDTAVRVVAQKYFKGKLGTSDREYSAKQMISRVVNQIQEWGSKDGYFKTKAEAQTFGKELTHLLVNQYASFNSPVWFNVGVKNTNGAWCYEPSTGQARRTTDDEHKPQVSACFILSVNDTIEDILQWYVEEGYIFANGSGSGVNLSTLRGSMEDLSGGGRASGPVTFMKPADANAGTIKSGGKTRRAAKMVILNADHPDILDFVWVKAKQERIVKDLIAAGYDGSFNAPGGAYEIVSYQNANNSVRATDEFMQAVMDGGVWNTRAVKGGFVVDALKAQDLLFQIAQAAHESGDPGMQFDTVINEYNTCSNDARINASNPCSEYMFLDDTACNLASLNLMKFLLPDNSFDVEGFCHAVDTMITAQEILVSNGGYPTEKIALRSHVYRTLGLGYANLGALLMVLGLPYDSDAGRDLAAAITAIMTGEAYWMSARLAGVVGAGEFYGNNSAPMMAVMEKHRSNADALAHPLGEEARTIWTDAIERGKQHGYRNAQATVLAPTGTISFMMDCATTGVEPELGLVKYKTLVGGGTLKLVNPLVKQALERGCKYSSYKANRIAKYVEENGTVEGAPYLEPDLYDIFDTSFPAGPSQHAIHYMGHVRMMAAVQPFLSGAVSKTVNLPSTATVEDIANVYTEAWKMKLKAIAVYRDGCKGSQPLTLNKTATSLPSTPVEQRKLVGDRPAIIHEFRIGGHQGFLTVGLYEDGTPGEIFVDISKEGSTISGLMDTIAILTSFCLQHGVPLDKLVEKFSFMRFDPSGFTGTDLGFAHSVPDYIFRWLGKKFSKSEQPQEEPAKAETSEATPTSSDTPLCPTCGTSTVRSGTCHRCPNCGETTGCG
jgi:ribonucleoside-diphosphate reductase alpha chain